MAKNITTQRYIFKISSSRIIHEDFSINMTLEEARSNDELIALSESQLMRYIDKLNNLDDCSKQIYDLKQKIKRLKKEKNIKESKPKIRECYNKLDNLIFKKDYINVVIDKPDDYKLLCEHGFFINGIPFHRLLGTPGGVKKNTITFVNNDLYPEINDFVNCGRNLDKAFIPAKLEAYKALVCSSSLPVSWPNGVIVIHDCITHFKDTYIKLDDTYQDNPEESLIENGDVELNANDGYGIAMPQLMERWGKEIGENFILPGCVIRNAWCKGAVFPIDFQKFCLDNNITEIEDVWGIKHNILEVELVLTESMLKLWDSYSSFDEYEENCHKYNYEFAITKNCEEELENQRTTNYQFIQSYDFTDEDIDELIKDTVDEIKDIMSGDYRKTILYMKGVGLNDKNICNTIFDGTISSALMIDKNIINDPYIQNQIYMMIKKRIDDAKIGVLNIPGNYSLVCGDPYSLCQSMCKLEVTGLLKAHQVYCKYWIDKGIDRIATFRAPMTSHNNIRILDVVHNEQMDEFYKYITTPTLFNSWDMCASALNGMDNDGDAVINTSSNILVNRAKELPAIECIQRKASKIVPTDEDLMESNIKSFGNAVGAVTNRVTSMFDVLAGLNPDSDEYKELYHRIKCGQLFQQNAIDKTKGIDAKPMPPEWYVWHNCSINYEKDDEETINKKLFNQKIVADKKPYFMRYIYPEHNKKYLEYIRNCEKKCMWNYLMTIDELESLDNKTDEQQKFLDIYHRKMPLGTNPCVINRICWKIENIFSVKKPKKENNFDYSIYKSGVEYNKSLYKKIETIYKEYQNELSEYAKRLKTERIKDDQKNIDKYLFKDSFKRKCTEICPNGEVLKDILIDICYSKSNSNKQFVWDMCGEEIIYTLLSNSGYYISYPTKADDGDFKFNGDTFKMVDGVIGEDLCWF